MEDKNKNQKLYQCPVCKMHYREESKARECEAWCRQHKSCNLDIIAHAVESERSGEEK